MSGFWVRFRIHTSNPKHWCVLRYISERSFGLGKHSRKQYGVLLGELAFRSVYRTGAIQGLVEPPENWSDARKIKTRAVRGISGRVIPVSAILPRMPRPLTYKDFEIDQRRLGRGRSLNVRLRLRPEKKEDQAIIDHLEGNLILDDDPLGFASSIGTLFLGHIYSELESIGYVEPDFMVDDDDLPVMDIFDDEEGVSHRYNPASGYRHRSGNTERVSEDEAAHGVEASVAQGNNQKQDDFVAQGNRSDRKAPEFAPSNTTGNQSQTDHDESPKPAVAGSESDNALAPNVAQGNTPCEPSAEISDSPSGLTTGNNQDKVNAENGKNAHEKRPEKESGPVVDELEKKRNLQALARRLHSDMFG